MPHPINTLTINVRWTDLDAYAHLSNTAYYDYMVEARVALFKEFMNPEIINDCQFVVVKNGCEYQKPFTQPGPIKVRQYLEKLGNTSFQLSYVFTEPNDDNLIYAKGFAVMVLFNTNTQKPEALPQIIRDKLSSSEFLPEH